MHQLRVKTKTVFSSTKHLLSVEKNMYIFLVLFILIAMILQWAFQYEVLWEIISNEALNAGQKIQEVFKAFVRLFTLSNNITPISILLVSLTQALSVTMLLSLRHSKVSKSVGSTGLAMLGVGCVSCGGSLLSPVLATVASNISVAFANALGNIVLIISLILSYNLLIKVAMQYAVNKKNS